MILKIMFIYNQKVWFLKIIQVTYFLNLQELIYFMINFQRHFILFHITKYTRTKINDIEFSYKKMVYYREKY